MFKSEEFIYVQMPKTGCTHIALQFGRVLDGVQIGKHNRPSEREISQARYVFSSIRNPWDWYLSLWMYGVRGEGLLQRNLLNRDPVRVFRNSGGGIVRRVKASFHEFNKNLIPKAGYYDDSENVSSFRRWLRFILEPGNRHLLGDGYGDVPIENRFGFMTNRYARLCWKDPSVLKKSGITTSALDLLSLDKDNCYIDFFIKLETLEFDLCEAIELMKPLDYKEKQRIYSAKLTNSSQRVLDISRYYDEHCIDLVLRNEELLISKFGYSEHLCH